MTCPVITVNGENFKLKEGDRWLVSFDSHDPDIYEVTIKELTCNAIKFRSNFSVKDYNTGRWYRISNIEFIDKLRD